MIFGMDNEQLEVLSLVLSGFNRSLTYYNCVLHVGTSN